MRKKEGNSHLSTGLSWPWLEVLACVCPSRDTLPRAVAMRPQLALGWGDSLKPEAVGLLGVLDVWGADRPGEVQGKGHHRALQHREQQEQQGWQVLSSLAPGARAPRYQPSILHVTPLSPTAP